MKVTRGQKKTQRQRRREADRIIDDSTDRKGAEKRPADDNATKEAEEEKESAATKAKAKAKA